jgi:hypothetical protein
MRKADIKVGEEYAAGSPSTYDRWKLARVRVVELDGERIVDGWNGKQRDRGIVVALVEDSRTYRLSGKAGDELVLSSARNLIQSWASYAEAKAAHDERQHAAAVERRRRCDVAEAAELRLRALSAYEGARWNTTTGVFAVPADTMARIVALIPGGES